MKYCDKLREKFDAAVSAYEKELCHRWYITDGYWVSDDKSGLYYFRDEYYLTLENMVYVVDNDISYEEFVEWHKYNYKASEFRLNYITLRSWHNGCQRASDEVFARLDKLKKDFEDACEKVKSEF